MSMNYYGFFDPPLSFPLGAETQNRVETPDCTRPDNVRARANAHANAHTHTHKTLPLPIADVAMRTSLAAVVALLVAGGSQNPKVSG